MPLVWLGSMEHLQLLRGACFPFLCQPVSQLGSEALRSAASSRVENSDPLDLLYAAQVTSLSVCMAYGNDVVQGRDDSLALGRQDGLQGWLHI